MKNNLKKALAIALAAGMIFPVNNSFADQSEKADNEEKTETEEPINVGKRDWKYTNYKIAYKLDGKDCTLDTIIANLIPGSGYDYHLVNLDEFKGAVKATNFDFEIIGEDENEIEIKKTNSSDTNSYKIGKQTHNGKKYIDLLDFVHKLGFRAYSLENNYQTYENMVFVLKSDKSDIASPSFDEFKKEVQKHDYTVIFPYKAIKTENPSVNNYKILAMEKYIEYLNKQKNYDVGVIGLVTDYKNFTKDDIKNLYGSKGPQWTVFGQTDEINKYINEKNGNYDPSYCFYEIYMVDKDLNILGEPYQNYREKISDIYLNLANHEEKTNPELDQVIDDIASANFIDYTVNGKTPSETDIKDYKKASTKKIIEDLKSSLDENRVKCEAAKLLLDKYPKTIKSVKDKLKKLIDESNKYQKEAEETIKELEKSL